MAVKKKEELLNAIKGIIGDNTSDEAIALIEDITDTCEDYENRTKDQTDWKAKCEETEKNWREKYTARFFSPIDKTIELDKEDDGEKEPPKNYEDLFKEGEK